MSKTKRGMGAIRDVAAKVGQGGGGPDTNWFYWKSGETLIVRFLTDGDEILLPYVHSRVTCQDGKFRDFVCQREFMDSSHPDGPAEDPATESGCELCVQKVPRREVGHGIAVLREEVRDPETGALTGYTDHVEEKDGKVQPWVGIVKQSVSNFWVNIESMWAKYGSLNDFDMEIKRQGDGTSTIYMPFNCPPVVIPNLRVMSAPDEDGNVHPMQKMTAEGELVTEDGKPVFLKPGEGRYDKYTPDLEEQLQRMASKEYYDRFLRGIDPKGETVASSSPSQTTQSTFTEKADDQTEFDRLKAAQEAASTTASYS